MLTINLMIFLITFAVMEGVAWFMHKYVMHGLLWNLHRDHHVPHDKKFEKNDLFFLIFALPGITLIAFGVANGAMDPRLWAGCGITLYGFAYLFVHDIFVHQRLNFVARTDNRYLKALRRAHRIHHKNQGKHDGESFGMLWVSRKYWPDKK